METIDKIRRRRLVQGESISAIARDLGLARNTVKRALRFEGEAFESRGLKPFQYQKGERLINLSFHMAPDELFDDPEEARIWATRAYEAALRSASLAKPSARARIGGKKNEPDASRTRRGSPRR